MLIKVLERFYYAIVQTCSDFSGSQFKLIVSQASDAVKDKFKMKEIQYARVVGSLIYAIVCIRPDITYSMGIVNRS